MRVLSACTGAPGWECVQACECARMLVNACVRHSRHHSAYVLRLVFKFSTESQKARGDSFHALPAGERASVASGSTRAPLSGAEVSMAVSAFPEWACPLPPDPGQEQQEEDHG